MSKRTALHKALERYQELLGLHDWAIALYENCKPDMMSLEHTDGEVEVTESTKVAVIRLIDTNCVSPTLREIDKNQVLWHELLHIKFCLIDDGANNTHDRVLHQIIDDLAKMLAKLTTLEEGEKK